MEKRHISIIGSCVSRHMFNTPALEELFTVDRYAYQLATWDICSPGLEIGRDEINKYYKEEFTARMVWYDLAKVTLTELELAESEYLLIDLYTIIQNVRAFTLGGNTVYSQVSYDRYSNFINAKESGSSWRDIVFEVKSLREIDEQTIINGFARLAEWVKKNYKPENTVIMIPPFAKRYIKIDNEICSYSEEYLKTQEGSKNTVEKYSIMLSSMIPGSHLLDLSREPVLAQYGIYDDIKRIVPTDVHYTDENYVRYSELFLRVLGINSPATVCGEHTPIGYECIRFRNLFLKKREEAKAVVGASQTETILTLETNLNEYVKRINDPKDFIIIISAKDEAKNLISRFTEKEKLGLKMELIVRGSYIAVVDMSRNFIYEYASADAQSYEYKVGDVSFVIESRGYASGNFSSIKRIRDLVSEEFSENRRGLNIALFNAKTLEIVDRFKCDTHLDTDLKVESRYVARLVTDYKIKI